MGLWSEATIVCSKPKGNIKRLIEHLNPNYAETTFTYSYTNAEGLSVSISSTEILGDEFNSLLRKISRVLKQNNERHYIHVTSTWYIN